MTVYFYILHTFYFCKLIFYFLIYLLWFWFFPFCTKGYDNSNNTKRFFLIQLEIFISVVTKPNEKKKQTIDFKKKRRPLWGSKWLLSATTLQVTWTAWHSYLNSLSLFLQFFFFFSQLSWISTFGRKGGSADINRYR